MAESLLCKAMSRREFLERTVQGSALLWVSQGLARPLAARAASQSKVHTALSATEWEAVEAIAARILPTDEDPGSREAGCVNFIDKALANEDAMILPLYQMSLAALEGHCQVAFENSFAGLSEGQQDKVLSQVESGKISGWPQGPIRPEAFFATVRFHTLVGFVANPSYGGNQDYVGWKVMGFPGPRHHLGGGTPEQMVGRQKIPTVWGEEID
jgi:gluconate 2-dehydrogenase gamma chain